MESNHVKKECNCHNLCIGYTNYSTFLQFSMFHWLKTDVGVQTLQTFLSLTSNPKQTKKLGQVINKLFTKCRN